jgi:hypothetical protein
MKEAVEMVIEEDGNTTDGLEEVEDTIAALDGEVSDAKGGVGRGEEAIVEEGIHSDLRRNGKHFGRKSK